MITFSCRQSNHFDYPEIVIQNNKMEQFNLAIVELYKLNSCPTCSCQALIFNDSLGNSKNDTLNVLSLEIDLDSMYFRRDTVTYSFRFYAYDKKNYATIIGDKYGNCWHHYGIEFISDSKIPFRYLISESAYIDYVDIPNRDSLDFKFQQCLEKNNKFLNKWLLKHKNMEK